MSYSDDEKVDLMRMSVPPGSNRDSPECQGNISAVGVSPESFDGSDIIPFHDSEYEQIGENDLMFSYAVDSDADENSSKSAIEKNPEPLSSESMEAGLDSALGRSVSNPSLHMDVRCSLPTLTVIDTEPNAHLSHTSGVLDFGYSSEGHSNEEPESAMAGKRGPGNLAANTLEEEAVSYTPGPDSAGTSGIGTNTVQRSGFYRITDASLNESAVSSLLGPNLCSSVHRELVGEETDDDFSRLNELPLDDAPSASELDLLAKLSDDSRTGVMRTHGRSLDSLAPLGSDKLFMVEKRVSSVEIIVDSVASSSRPSFSSQMSRDSATEENGTNNGFLLQTSGGGHKFLAPSSCDASSEGTLSDSEFSDLGVSDGSPSKSRPLSRRVRRSVRSSLWKLYNGTSVKSPTKRRMENLVEIPTAASHMTRSTSHGAIEHSRQLECSEVKRSKVCRSLSDLQDGHSPRKAAAGHGSRSNFASSKKVPLRRSAHRLNFAEDVFDPEPLHIAECKSGSTSQSNDHHVSQNSTGLYILF